VASDLLQPAQGRCQSFQGGAASVSGTGPAAAF